MGPGHAQSESDLPRVRDVRLVGPAVVMLAVSVVGLMAAYAPVFAFWWEKWFEPESYYSHGPFVPLASAALVAAARRKIAILPLRPSLIGLALMVPAILVGLLGRMSAATSAMGLVLPIYVLGAVIVVLGLPAARMLWFPVLFLFFMGVLPESVTGALSFRLTVSLLAIGVFLAYIRPIPAWRKLLLVVLALPLGLGLNVLRITTVSMISVHQGRGVTAAVHDWTGWAILLLAAGLLFLVSKPKAASRPVQQPAAQARPGVLVAKPDYQPREEGDWIMEQDRPSLLESLRDQTQLLPNEEQTRAAFEKTIQAQKQLESAAIEVREMERALANAQNAVVEARQSFIDARAVLMELLGMRETESAPPQEPRPKANCE